MARSRTEPGPNVSTRRFLIGLAAVVVGLAAFALWLYYR
jgi:hypothetical protein